MHAILAKFWKSSHLLRSLVIASFAIFLISSVIRHLLLQSNALDLGYFDQAVYLISQGITPIISFRPYHVMGDHAAWILYAIAGIYKIFPSVYWLFVIQSAAFATSAIPVWYLAKQAGLDRAKSNAIAISFLLYPLVFNLNLFDFRPEVISLPLFFTAIWAARANRMGWFTLCVVLILGCRASLALSIAAMGIWLIGFEQRKRLGAIALILGVSWFIIATQGIIPHFRPSGADYVMRYSYLGNSLTEIVQNLILNPWLWLGRLLSIDRLFYLLLIFIPIGWGFSIRHFAPLIATVPVFAMNLLSEMSNQRDLVHQYSLPILPFLMVMAISTVAANPNRRSRLILVWSLIAFLALAKFGYFGSRYLERVPMLSGAYTAIEQITTKEPVLTTSYFVPHLTHRVMIDYTKFTEPPKDLNKFRYILLNLEQPGWASRPELAQQIFSEAQANSAFQLQYQQDQLYLFVKKS
ncbi:MULTISPECIES: DUF2079 domain-containing protein [Leptolyngbya]|uniref:DUF2079 domain-containing protein n=1 Tax=Leptolyngbya TaxID=47251 RepID=UPI0016897896|nr:DUF2079 domain-containing protein [Leptolyngbya sp. FACHB-1624]MBD1854644.1 DUF2079 domain-containing protein [Leptolyngbya sp. FACHB-1624]